jgi:hypothetical protein
VCICHQALQVTSPGAEESSPDIRFPRQPTPTQTDSFISGQFKPAHICRSGVAIEELRLRNNQQTPRNHLNLEQGCLVLFTSAKGPSRRPSTEFTYRKICKRNTSLLTPTPTPGSTLLSIQAPAATLLEQALEFQSPPEPPKSSRSLNSSPS